MFRAKTAWIVDLGPYEMVRGDQKDFEVDGWKFGVSVLEVTEVEPVLAVAESALVAGKSAEEVAATPAA